MAERVATLDLLYNGRVEFGVGEIASNTELDPFSVSFEDRREIWEEMVQAVIPMFGGEPVEFDGKWFSMLRRLVVPQPLQRPHPPILGRLLAA